MFTVTLNFKGKDHQDDITHTTYISLKSMSTFEFKVILNTIETTVNQYIQRDRIDDIKDSIINRDATKDK